MKKQIAIIIAFLIAIVGFQAFKLDDLLTLEGLIANKDRLILFTSQHHLLSMVVFSLSYIVLIAIGLPVFSVYAIAAGLIFGFLEGLVLCVVSATIGGYLTFLASKTVLYDYFRKRHHKRADQLTKRLNGKSFRVLLVMRLIPGVPYTLTNILAGLSSLDWLTFGIVTIIGIIPGTSVFLFSGYALRRVDRFEAFKQPEFVIATILLALVIVIAFIRWLMKRQKN